MAQFYIEVDTYWQKSTSYFVGPFTTRDEATAWHQQPAPENANVWYSDSNCGGDSRAAWRIYPTPISKTAATRRGMDDRHVLSVRVTPTAASLDRAVRNINELYQDV